jgi:hypothetical protein
MAPEKRAAMRENPAAGFKLPDSTVVMETTLMAETAAEHRRVSYAASREARRNLLARLRRR